MIHHYGAIVRWLKELPPHPNCLGCLQFKICAPIHFHLLCCCWFTLSSTDGKFSPYVMLPFIGFPSIGSDRLHFGDIFPHGQASVRMRHLRHAFKMLSCMPTGIMLNWPNWGDTLWSSEASAFWTERWDSCCMADPLNGFCLYSKSWCMALS